MTVHVFLYNSCVDILETTLFNRDTLLLNVCKFCLNEGTETDKIKAIFPPALNSKTEQVRIVTFYKHKTLIYISVFRPVVFWGRRGHDRMIDGYTTAYAIGLFHH